MNKISICGVAVIANPTVCDVCVSQATVFGEMKLFAPQSGNVVLSLGSFSGQLLSNVHGTSYKRPLRVSTRKLIYGYQQYRRVGIH